MAAVALLCAALTACNGVQADGSVKTVTRPYIAQYECTEAKLGDANLLNAFDYVKINFVNKDEFELIYKYKDGEKKTVSGNYSVDSQTRELTGDIGIFGYRFKEKVKIENGSFTVTKKIGDKQLFVKFEVK